MKIFKIKKSKIRNIDFENLDFGSVFSDHMFSCSYVDGKWDDGMIEPYKPILIDPSARSLHYGQACFEHGGIIVATNDRNTHGSICLEIKKIIEENGIYPL